MTFRNAAIGAGGLFCAAGMAVTIAGTAHAAPPGNNGTLKVHEYGAPSATVDNQPHVCQFNFEYFFQDSKQPGYELTIEPQGGNGGPDSLAFNMPAADAQGYSNSVYINIDPNGETDGYTLANGHYKATIKGKFGTNKDEKAKSKVFWVDCQDTTTPPSSSSSTPPPGSSTPPESSTPPGSSTPPEEPSSTPPSSSTTTAVPPAGTTTPPVTGPAVVTDGPSGGEGGNNALLGGGLAAIGVTLAGAGLLRRRMSE